MTPTPKPSGGDAHERPRGRRELITGLTLIALLVVFVLPQFVGDPEERPARAVDAPTGAGTRAKDTRTTNDPATASRTSTADSSEPAPWSEARRTEARRALQDIIGEARKMAATLEARGADSWDEPRLERALALMDQGDIAYADRDYRTSESRFVQGLAMLRAVLEEADARVERAIESATAALDAGRIEGVETALATVRRYRPEHPRLAALRARANTWPELQRLHQQALAHVSARDFAAAVTVLERAVTLDGDAAWLSEDLREARTGRRQQRFQEAMSRGFKRLDQRRHEEALAAFESARRYRSGPAEDAEITRALDQVTLLRTQDRLQSMARAAATARVREDWQEARKHYLAMLEIDNSLQLAQQGRRTMDMLIETLAEAKAWLDSPISLASDTSRTRAREVLMRWREVPDNAPALAASAAALERLLRAATTPVAVEVRSDKATEVVLLRHGGLGRFDRERLELLPGDYVFRGSRDGFRDVRVELRIEPGQSRADVAVNCVERI